MREIKFRVYDFNKKEMISHFKGARIDYALNYWETNIKVSKPMQYTGLKDRNDEDIYEGDIVHRRIGYSDRVGAYSEYRKITYNEELGAFIAEKKDGFDYENLDIYFLYEVIGNIYENPELLSNPETTHQG